MKAQDLQAVIEAGDVEGCIALFATATEAERRTLAKTATARLKAVTSELHIITIEHLAKITDDEFKRYYSADGVNPGAIRAAQVAVLATATPSELKKFGARCFPPVDHAMAVLWVRRPPWVGEWVEQILSWRNPGESGFNLGHR